MKANVIPGSDGAGTVIDTGSEVTRFRIGDSVAAVFANYDGRLTEEILRDSNIGAKLDGTFRQYGAFHEGGLVAMPSSLDFQEASTLTCAAVTAWNALNGLNALKPGDTVLTQGTGGVSTFAIQFAKAAGATVISTTSSEEKAQMLQALPFPPDHIVNPKTVSKWGQKVRELSPGGLGVDCIVEVGGPATLEQSFEAVKLGGAVSIVGILGGAGETQPSFLEVLKHGCIVRGVLVGNRSQFEEMNRFIDAKGIKPVIDLKVWRLEELKDAYQYLVSVVRVK